MNRLADRADRLLFLVRVVEKEAQHLQQTDGRLFTTPFDVDIAKSLESNPTLAERVEAFVSRFARLQDTVGDKLLPALMSLAEEPPRTMVENLDRAEKLGWIPSAEGWLSLRKLRNQMIHEYVEDPLILADALNLGHEAVATLIKVAQTLCAEIKRLLAAG